MVMLWQGPALFGTDFAKRIANGQAELEKEKHPVHGDRRTKRNQSDEIFQILEDEGKLYQLEE